MYRGIPSSGISGAYRAQFTQLRAYFRVINKLQCDRTSIHSHLETSQPGGGTGPPIYHLLGNVDIFDCFGLVYINLQPEYELPSSTRLGQFWKCGKLELGAPSSPATPKETRGLISCLWLPARQI